MKDKGESNPLPLLHVYPHYTPSEEVVLVGNRKALNRLKKAIEEALVAGEVQSENVSTSIIESYNIRIIANEESYDAPFWGSLKLPFAELEDTDPNLLDQYDLLAYKIVDSETLKEMEPEIENDRKKSIELTILLKGACQRNAD
ncbi:hypothetical protein [Evansella tamaricis]|uniref:Uncharacterized protein n=1 Tax=Evansella tamaricis TaxID=2069301 RepID=A0ABS6JB72_9BACI|nr:hypothetical protein [Evansella tamaricis]MBU9710890.1 hypothetical protein [Evansella tamaricis]